MNTKATPTGRLLVEFNREERLALLVAAAHASGGDTRALTGLMRRHPRKSHQWWHHTARVRAEMIRARVGLPPLPVMRTARARFVALVGGAIAEAGGNMRRAGAILGVTDVALRRHCQLFPELAGICARARAARNYQPWLVRTCAVLSLAPMLEQVVAAVQGMSVEEIEAEIRASVHADACDPALLAEALAAAAVDAAGG